jgi:hypothetical protein
MWKFVAVAILFVILTILYLCNRLMAPGTTTLENPDCKPYDLFVEDSIVPKAGGVVVDISATKPVYFPHGYRIYGKLQ